MKHALILTVFASAATAEPVFVDRSANLPPHVYGGDWEHFVGGGVAVFDCNNDALPDLFAAGGATPAALFINGGDFQFSPAPLPELIATTGAYPLDIDGDGLMDLFVLRAGANVALRGLGGCQFADATTDWGLPVQADTWSTAFSAWWEDDSRPVMAVGNYVDRSNPDGPFMVCDENAILRPETTGYSTEPLTPGFCPLSMLAARDARGRMTLRLSNDRQYYVRPGWEQMWDITDRRFLTEDDGWKKLSIWGMGIASRDLTGDGLDEVMLTSMGDNVLSYANADGSYSPARFDLGTYAAIPFDGSDGRPSTGWHAQFGDVDNDGLDDLFIAKGNVDQMPTNAIHDPNNLLMQQPDGTFVERADVAGVATTERSRGAALVDLDLDGRLDLVVMNRRASMELYRNETPDTGHWLGVSLSQSGGNRNAIGASVQVETAQGVHIQQVTVGGGHAGGQAGPLHFGLGQAAEATVTVTWPDGTATVQDVPMDQYVTITRAP